MTTLLAAAALGLHGLIHLIGFVVPWGIAQVEGFPYRTTALGGAITSYSGEEPGAAGTVYLQTSAQAAGRGTVTINNSSQTTAARTHIPPATNAVPDELQRAMVVLTNRGMAASTTNCTIGNLLIYTNCFWTLTNWTVSVNDLEHSLENLNLPGPGATNRVDHYNQVIWIGRPSGLMLMFK